MLPIRWLSLVTSLLTALVAGCADIPTRTPDDYTLDVEPNALRGERSCHFTRPANANTKPLKIFPAGGGDTVYVGGARPLIVFDSASPTALDVHDSIILQKGRPSKYSFQRIGADLLICGEAYWLEILVIRHFCSDQTATPPWNNQIEEFTFPRARETWLADHIYDAMKRSEQFPDVEHINNRYKVKEEAADAAAKSWRVLPFRDVLPNTWFSAASCNDGLEGHSIK